MSVGGGHNTGGGSLEAVYINDSAVSKHVVDCGCIAVVCG